MYSIFFSSAAQKDAIKIQRSNLASKCQKLIDIIAKDPFQTNPKYKKFTIKTESLAEAFKKRMIGNLKGSEYILSETFKRK